MMTILNVHIIYIAFMYIYKKVETKIIVCTPPPLSPGGERGGEPPTKFSKRGALQDLNF